MTDYSSLVGSVNDKGSSVSSTHRKLEPSERSLRSVLVPRVIVAGSPTLVRQYEYPTCTDL